MELFRSWRGALLSVSLLLALPSALARDVPVFAGGTKSVGQRGYHDMAVDDHTAGMRKLGVNLYVHPLGWDHTTDADKQVLIRNFPNPPIMEASVYKEKAMTNQPKAWYDLRLKKAWPKLFAVTVNYINDAPVDATKHQREAFADVTDTIAPVFSPNVPNVDPVHQKNPKWNDPAWDTLRAHAMAGGGLATDAPPDFYFSREEAYRVWIADAIKWCKEKGLKAIVIVYARDSGDFADLTDRYIADLEGRGATPAAWAFDGYYAANHDAKHPMGDDRDRNSQNYAAKRAAAHEKGESPDR